MYLLSASGFICAALIQGLPAVVTGFSICGIGIFAALPLFWGTITARMTLAVKIRELKPRVVILPYWDARHPDHYRASEIGFEACFLAGLRTATRGIAQLKDGMSRVTRAGTRDSVAQRRAGRFLAGLCGSSRGFLKRGRPHMTPTVYEDSVQLKARRLVTQVDSMIKYTTTCEDSAGATPNATVVGLGKRMKSYDAALRDFRVAIGLPVKEDTSKTAKRP